MKTVKVILRQDMEKLGTEGDIITVKPGFARNYLLPRGFAYEATAGNVKRIEEERRRVEARSKRDYLEAKRRAGEESKLFGSITSADIAERLASQGLDFEIDRRQLDLDEPIKALGVFSVPVRLHAEVRPEIKIWVVKEE
jgi:large subunit ribosomal protein L9